MRENFLLGDLREIPLQQIPPLGTQNIDEVLGIEHGEKQIPLPEHHREIPLGHTDTVQRDVHVVVLPSAGQRSGLAVLRLELQLYQQVSGALVVEIVDLGPGIEAHAGDGKGDGVGDAAFPYTHMAGDHIHAAETKRLRFRVTLESAHGEPGHAELLDGVDHRLFLLTRPVGRGSLRPGRTPGQRRSRRCCAGW